MTKNKIRFGYFYTEGTVYEKIANDYILKSLNKFPTEILVTVTENFNNWNRNVAEKPKVILDQLNRLTEDECLVFLDVDCEVCKWPELFENIPKEYDIALHYLSWEDWYGYKGVETRELLTGTMFFRPNDKVKKLCEHWHEEAVKSNEWEQKTLERILPNHPIKVYELPLSYIYINSRPGGLPPLVKIEDPFIIHYQKSREYKRNLGGMRN